MISLKKLTKAFLHQCTGITLIISVNINEVPPHPIPTIVPILDVETLLLEAMETLSLDDLEDYFLPKTCDSTQQYLSNHSSSYTCYIRNPSCLRLLPVLCNLHLPCIHHHSHLQTCGSCKHNFHICNRSSYHRHLFGNLRPPGTLHFPRTDHHLSSVQNHIHIDRLHTDNLAHIGNGLSIHLPFHTLRDPELLVLV